MSKSDQGGNWNRILNEICWPNKNGAKINNKQNLMENKMNSEKN